MVNVTLSDKEITKVKKELSIKTAKKEKIRLATLAVKDATKTLDTAEKTVAKAKVAKAKAEAVLAKLLT